MMAIASTGGKKHVLFQTWPKKIRLQQIPIQIENCPLAVIIKGVLIGVNIKGLRRMT